MAIETTALHAHIAVSFSLQIQNFLTKSQLGHFSILHLNFAEIHTRKIRMTGSGPKKIIEFNYRLGQYMHACTLHYIVIRKLVTLYKSWNLYTVHYSVYRKLVTLYKSFNLYIMTDNRYHYRSDKAIIGYAWNVLCIWPIGA